MTTTTLIAKIVGPVLVVRAVSILLDQHHFIEMIDGLGREVATVSFSFFPIALMMAGIAILVLHSDRSSPAAVLIFLMALGAVTKASALMLFPGLVAQKAMLLQRAGFLHVVLLVCIVVGGYFTWFGYFGPAESRSSKAPALS